MLRTDIEAIVWDFVHELKASMCAYTAWKVERDALALCSKA